jgi:hypothetical protein
MTFLPFFESITEEEMTCLLYSRPATAHTANSSINVLKETSQDTMISGRLWPARSSDFVSLGKPGTQTVPK